MGILITACVLLACIFGLLLKMGYCSKKQSLENIGKMNVFSCVCLFNAANGVLFAPIQTFFASSFNSILFFFLLQNLEV